LSLDHYFGHIAGESFRNNDGTSRQAIIRRCHVGEVLRLEPEPSNPHDANAMRVLRMPGEQIGYLERSLALRVAGEGGDHYAAIATIRRPRLSRHYGVGIMIIVATEQVTYDDIAAYVRHQFVADRRAHGPVRSREAAHDAPMAPAVIGLAAVFVGTLVLGWWWMLR
jgi:hypothetical protein